MRWSVACAALGLLALAAALVWTAGGARAEAWIARAEGWIWLEERTASSLTISWRWFGPVAAFELGWRASGDGASTIWRTARVSGAERPYRIAGLEDETRYVVRVRALDANGQMLGDLRGVFTPGEIEPLWLGLGVSQFGDGDVCTEAGMRELYWDIYGGVPPYTLTINGEPVDPDRMEGFSVFCGLRPSDPQPCDPEPKLHQTFRAAVTDSRGITAEAELQAVVAAPPNRTITGSVLPPMAASDTALRLAWETGLNPYPWYPWVADSAACAYELRYQSTNWKADSWPDSWTTISETVGPDETEYLHDGLLPNRRYRYQVRARNNVGAGEWSRPFPRTAARPGAAVLAASTAVSGSVALSWSAAPSGAARWEYRQRPAGGRPAAGSWSAWTAIAGSGARTARYLVSGLIEDVRYHFQVRAVGTGGPARASAIATAAAGLTPTPTPTVLRYDEYDATGGATAPGAYAFLADATDLSSGIVHFADAPTAAALLVNVVGRSSGPYADFLNGVAVGDSFTWEHVPSCWFAYRVTDVLSDPPTPGRKLFAIELTAQDSCMAPVSVRGSYDRLIWGPPPSEPRIGADGMRILPTDYPVEGGHTYRLSYYGSSGRIVIDVPAGMRLIYHGVPDEEDSWGTRIAFFEDEMSGAELALDFDSGEDDGRYFPPEYGSSGETRDVDALFDAIIASARVQPER